MKFFVIAGTVQEANHWIKNECQRRWESGDTSVTLSDYVYVTNADRLRGYTNPRGRFVGNWRGRPDILEIIQTIISRTQPANITLINLFNEMNGKTRVRPTPKILSGYQANIDHAGLLMAQAIDAEVLRNLTQKINGGII